MGAPGVYALVVAAGRGERFGAALPKQYASLAGRAVLAWSVDAVMADRRVAGLRVVIAEQDRALAARALPGLSQEMLIAGGPTRAKSVLNGLVALERNHPDAWVLVHDAARPVLPASALARLLEAGLQSEDGAILAVPAGDTLKQAADDGRIESDVDRTRVWMAQTPQLFPIGRLRLAIERMLARGRVPTDEAGAMQHAGARPLLVEGSVRNLKITRPGDLEMAERWVRPDSHRSLAS
ncbi:MAG: 2-C-methyl-D-erythritol 4-phosphate cytidylyltransferase [Xanthomonadales bacterium]|nr:2-C-methyl-D-erythritol 4-phosphate cytidylyltransferase [Xanthomonadales bacterium]